MRYRTQQSAGALHVDLTTRPYSRLVDTFCQEYKTAFVFPKERETRSGLRLCLALNGAAGEAVHARFGPSRECVALLHDAGKAVAGGMNFICFPMHGLRSTMTVHTTYVFVNPDWRGRGLLRTLYQTIEDVARTYSRQCGMPDDTTILFVGEQKDPLSMTLADYRAAAEAYGIDAFDRLAMWGRLGARMLLLRYVQPSLTPGGLPDATLFLRVLFREESSDSASDTKARGVDPKVLKEHLRRFFGVSVAKGLYDPDCLPEVQRQMDDLDAWLALAETVPALRMPSAHRLAEWKRATLAELRADRHPVSSTLGTVLGIASLHEAVHCGDGAV
jgi:GNAT superfamily N-acetyltransferase